MESYLPLPDGQVATVLSGDGTMPHDVSTHTRRAGYDAMLVDGDGLGPTALSLGVVLLGMILQADGSRAGLVEGLVACAAGTASGTGHPEQRRGVGDIGIVVAVSDVAQWRTGMMSRMMGTVLVGGGELLQLVSAGRGRGTHAWTEEVWMARRSSPQSFQRRAVRCSAVQRWV